MIILKLLLALLPAILLAAFIYWKDAKKEPVSWLAKAFGLGITIVFPIIIVEIWMGKLLFAGGEPTTLFGGIMKAFFEAALPEEALKLFALWILLRKNPYFDEHFDGIVYAVYIGLGFAALENVFYILDAEDWVTVGIMRALLSVTGHYAYAVIMGYYYSLYHFVDKSARSAFLALFLPFLAHGMYDAILMGAPFNPILKVISLPIIIYLTYRMQKVAYNRIKILVKKDSVL
jgi:RsiW-degrading membrane proteinase PrsW (M82 family)